MTTSLETPTRSAPTGETAGGYKGAPTRNEFLAEIGAYLSALTEDAVATAVALYTYENGLDASTASGPVDREARRVVVEQLAEWASEALSDGALLAEAEPESPLEAARQRSFPDFAEEIADLWGTGS